MPLIILTGYPCSGLTYRAHQLASLLESTQSALFDAGVIPASKPRYKIHVVPTHDYSHPRTVYDNARTEKETRGVAYARAKRLLGRDSFVILDGMNYIKGYRYQLWCEAKALGTTCCVVHVGTPVDQCVANNEARLHRESSQTPETKATPDEASQNPSSQPPPATSTTPQEQAPEDPYPPELLNNLIFRYEEPSTASRWDKPLFTVPWADAEPPTADIWTALTGIAASPDDTPTPAASPAVAPLAATLAATHLSDTASVASGTTTARGGSSLRRAPVKPHQATVLPPATDSSALYSMEKRTSAIVSAIRSFTLAHPSAEAALAQSPHPAGIAIAVPEASAPVFVPAHVATSGSTDELAGAGGLLALPRLQRLRRQWISLNRSYVAASHSSNRGSLAPEQVPDAFVRFLNADFAGDQ
ncbi:chromatin associated protein KTI12 [Aspergillus ambiguus]|uniref:putative RNA polymerase II Elongator complex associated protein Kti12 n=1 Tax=Aspergillus ambiguus TaxID=176160 RepID=UPI003CCCE217